MSFPLPTTPTTTIVNKVDYNDLRDATEEILGLNPSGYGVASIRSVPVTNRNQASTSQWTVLLADLNNVHQHIYGVTTSTALPTTGTVLTAATANAIYALTQSLSAARYQIHESQYFVDPVSGESIINVDIPNGTVSYSTSTNTYWTGSMTHIVRMGFASEEIARYFFNTGGKLVWNTFYDLASGETGADTAWATFLTQQISSSSIPQDSIYEYDRTKYLAGNDTAVIVSSSATLQITVSVEQTLGRLFKLTATYQDLKPGGLELAPDGYTWRY
jgi:hypothetical protein